MASSKAKKKTRKAPARPLKVRVRSVAPLERIAPTQRAKRPASSMLRNRHKDALVVLLELTRKLADQTTLELALSAVTDATIEIIGADHASIRLLDASHSELLSGARSGAGTTRRPMTFRKGQGVLGWVVEYKEPIVIDDARIDPRFVAQPAQGFNVVSLIAEPMWSAGAVIGVLSGSSPRERAFGPDDQLLMRLLANCSTPPIERARLRRLALTDDLTLAFNQRYLSPRYNEEIERAKRTGQPLSVLMLDLDHFKTVNDRFGHDAGDVALRLFADRVRSLVRRVDIFIRRGGEEFLIVMPTTTNAQARATAERIRRSLAETELDLGGGTRVRQTVSIGAATWDGSEVPEALLRRADVALYQSKEQGRDRVSVSPPPHALKH